MFSEEPFPDQDHNPRDESEVADDKKQKKDDLLKRVQHRDTVVSFERTFTYLIVTNPVTLYISECEETNSRHS